MLILLVIILLLVVVYTDSLELCTSQQLIYIRDNYLAIRHHYHHYHHYHHNHHNHGNYHDNITRNNDIMININDDTFCNDDNAYMGSWCYLGDRKVQTG